jgi:hypothetical protein
MEDSEANSHETEVSGLRDANQVGGAVGGTTFSPAGPAMVTG